MKKFTLFISIILSVFCSGILSSQNYYSVTEVYTDQTITAGDTLWVLGDYTEPDRNVLVESFSDWMADQPLPPHSMLILEGMQPPVNAYNGGWILAKGTIRYEVNPDPYFPEDSLIAYLDVFYIEVWLDGASVPPPTSDSSGNSQGYLYEAAGCDSCKFALIISGGINNHNNHDRYWESVEALYKFKVDSGGYCQNNVYVNYYKGNSEDPGAIPHAKVDSATNNHIKNSFNDIKQKIAACKANNKEATFQLMISNHGGADGSIPLLGTERLDLDSLKSSVQKLIDACCSKIYAEFLQCYGGYSVDKLMELDIKSKTTVHANSAADHKPGFSSDGEPHRYLKGKIDSLDNNGPYGGAVVAGKLNYDKWLQHWANWAHDKAQQARVKLADPATPAADTAVWRGKLNEAKNDSATWSSAICKSRNVTVTPMKKYCQWEQFVVPPGGQLILDFEGDSKYCGNVTVYRDDPAAGKKKEKVFNWNLEGSSNYSGNNKRRVVNGSTTASTTFRVHNDNGPFKLTTSVTGNQDLPEDSSNAIEYPGTSFGGDDNSNSEFTVLTQQSIWIENIDQVPFFLNTLPGVWGIGYTEYIGGSFTVDPNNIYASNMSLYLNILSVPIPGNIKIDYSGSDGIVTYNIPGPGEYNIPLGDLRPYAQPIFFQINASGTSFDIDSWGFRSMYQPSAIPDVDLCFGNCTMLTASGGISYIWSTGETTESINVCPQTTTTYFVTVTDPGGGTFIDHAKVTVHTHPIVTASSNAPVNTGDSLQLSGQASQPGIIPDSYCTSQMDNTYEWITNITFNGASNSSGPDPLGYGNYKAFVLSNVSPGGSYPIDVTISPDSPPEWITVFIDINRNGIFEPNEETLLGDAISGNITGVINIPLNAVPGETALRVINKWGGTSEINPCLPGSFGETEDYKVKIDGITPAPVDTWAWTGPNAFTSFEQNPSRPNMSISDAGLYTLNVTTINGCSGSNEVFVDVLANKALVTTRTMLQANYAGGGLMTTNLNPVIPNDQPFNREPWNYMGMENLNSVPANSIAPLNMVDWILVEIRDGGDPTMIIAQRAAILLDNGSVVDTNLSTSIAFPGIPPGNYHICLHHRNSLPVMSANPIPLPNSVQFDFSDPAANPPYGGMAQALIELEPGVYGMIGGDVNSDGTLKYSGPGNDRALVLQLIVNVTGSSSITATTDGYFDEDNNMNGTVKYSGPQNDPSIIIQNIVNLTGSPSITTTVTTPVPEGVQWMCGDDLVDSRDGNAYSTILIGTQCWMAENLKYLPEVYPSSDGSYTEHRYYVYNYNGTNVATAKTFSQYIDYGVLYNWAASMSGEASSNNVPSGVKGICPDGWHLPSDEEWKVLEGEVDTQYGYPDGEWDGTNWRGLDAGGNLKETGTAHWASPNTGATNISGFTALPGGSRGSAGSYSSIGLSGYYWSSFEYSANVAYYRFWAYHYMESNRKTISKTSGFSVRCIMD